MNFYVYATYNSYMDVYDTPIFQKYDDKEMLEAFRRMIFDNPEEAFKKHFDEKTLFVLGEYDDRKGTLITFEQPKAVGHLASMFPKGFLAKKEQEKQMLESALMGGLPHAQN